MRSSGTAFFHVVWCFEVRPCCSLYQHYNSSYCLQSLLLQTLSSCGNVSQIGADLSRESNPDQSLFPGEPASTYDKGTIRTGTLSNNYSRRDRPWVPSPAIVYRKPRIPVLVAGREWHLDIGSGWGGGHQFLTLFCFVLMLSLDFQIRFLLLIWEPFETPGASAIRKLDFAATCCPYVGNYIWVLVQNMAGVQS